MLDNEQLYWDEEVKLEKNDIAGGAGWMRYQPIGKKFPIYEISSEMIRVSDNTATNLIIKRLGGKDKINKGFMEIGLVSTKLNELLPDLKGTNTTTTKDLVRSIALGDSDKFLSKRSRDLFREIMSMSRTNRLIPGGLLLGLNKNASIFDNIDYKLLLKGYRVYNKTGDIGTAYADAGLIQTPNNTRAIASFIVQGPFNDPRSPELIRKMSAAIVPLLKPKSPLD